MVDKAVNISISGDEETFKRLEASIASLSKALGTLGKKSDDAGKSARALKLEEGRARQAAEKFNTVMAASGKALEGEGKALAGLAMGFAKTIPYIGTAIVALGALGTIIQSVYNVFLKQNQMLLETGDVFASIDMTSGDVASSFKKMRGELIAMSFATLGGTTTVKDHLSAIRGYSEAGIVVSDLRSRFLGLQNASKLAIQYGTLFSMKTEEMAAMIGEFTRELNLGAGTSEEAFHTLFRSSVKAQYGTKNFMKMVQQTIPTMGYFGGSVKEVGRMLEFMGKTGVISMRQAQETITQLTVGMKEMNWQDRIVAAGLLKINDVLDAGRSRIATLKKEQSELGRGSVDWQKKQLQISQMEMDVTAAMAGNASAAGRILQQSGAGELIKLQWKGVETILGKQFGTLGDLAKMSADQQNILLSGGGELYGITEKSLAVMKSLSISAEGNADKTIDQLSDAIKNGDITASQLITKTDEEIAEEARKATQDMVKITLENIYNLLLNKLWPNIATISEGIINMLSWLSTKLGGVDYGAQLRLTKTLVTQGFDFEKLQDKSVGQLQVLANVNKMLEEEMSSQKVSLANAGKNLAEEFKKKTEEGKPLTEKDLQHFRFNIESYSKQFKRLEPMMGALKGLGKELVIPEELTKGLSELSQTLDQYTSAVPAGAVGSPKTAAAGPTINQYNNVEIKDSTSPATLAKALSDDHERKLRIASRP